MEIPNLSQTNLPQSDTKTFSLPIIFIILVLAVTAGFFLSRFIPQNKSVASIDPSSSKNGAISTDKISDKDEIKVGMVYGNTSKVFNDSATGVIEKGSINGEGTHILNRDGGASQRASLLSSVVDLDLFVGRKVEVKGQTNASNKTGWLLDVGSVKVLE
jgi:hypothetical protein